MPKLSVTDWSVLLLSAALATAYGVAGQHMSAEGASLTIIAAFKASSIILLAAIAGVNGRRLLAVALFLGAVGDAGLAFGGAFILAGAGAFLLGHLAYIALFIHSGADAAALRAPWRLGAVAALALAAFALTIVLVPSANPLFFPLAAYTGVLTLMAMTAFTLPAARWLAMIGAVLFFISDGFVAANMFHPQADPTLAFASSFTGWMIYWAGQAALCLGMLNTARRARPEST